MNGALVAAVTALISGVSVFVNSFGVHHVAQPSVYTAAKNIAAFAFLAAVGLAARGARRPVGVVAGQQWLSRWIDVAPPLSWSGRPRSTPPGRLGRTVAVAYVGVVGGGLAFILFFDGLARTAATPAAFLHDTLVIWVALLAWPLLSERVTGWNVAAIALLIGGEIGLLGGVGDLAANRGDVLVLGATVLWSVEAIVAKWLLCDMSPARLSLLRMGVGSVTLAVYLGTTGALGQLVSLDPGQLAWVVVTGLLLAGYVGTWMTALARARAVDVTSVLVASALVTGLLDRMAGDTPFVSHWSGLVLIAAGSCLALWATRRDEVTA
jgi:drug/metabolite transporter (DMT)-like permease